MGTLAFYVKCIIDVECLNGMIGLLYEGYRDLSSNSFYISYNTVPI